jgi:DNA-directed RNA polymerase subunit RPC12/RpoP
MPGETVWIYDDNDGYWECKNCSLAWVFDYDGPEENQVNFCPKCGFKIVKYLRGGE